MKCKIKWGVNYIVNGDLFGSFSGLECLYLYKYFVFVCSLRNKFVNGYI